jgi:hypothetical protein
MHSEKSRHNSWFAFHHGLYVNNVLVYFACFKYGLL